MPIIYVVDDDLAVWKSLDSLLRSKGFSVRTFATAREFLQFDIPDEASCLLLDVRLPGMSGLDLQNTLIAADVQVPIIFMTAHAEIPQTVRAMKAGAVEFLTKPFRHDQLLETIRQVIERDAERRQDRAQLRDLRDRFDSLTPRERQVMGLVVAGLLNKQIAGELGASQVTIKLHRSHAMRKMRAASLADLVRMAEKLAQAGIK